MSAQDEQYAHPELLAETGWLQEHLEDASLRILDCDPPDAYRRAHIPGAVNLPDNYLKEPDDRIKTLAEEPFARLMESLGIGDDTLVVTYDSYGSLYATRAWWVLNYYGHTTTKVLNGGWRKWLAEGRPITYQRPEVPSGLRFTPRVQPEVLATLEQVKAGLGRQDVLFWDVRTRREYTGENPRDNRRVGHLPGAVHLEWVNALNDDGFRTFKSPAELRKTLEEAGIGGDKEVVAY